MSEQATAVKFFPAAPDVAKNRLDETAINTRVLWGLFPVQPGRNLRRETTAECARSRKALCTRGERREGTKKPGAVPRLRSAPQTVRAPSLSGPDQTCWKVPA